MFNLSLFTNDQHYGGDFRAQITAKLKNSDNVIIASGYVSSDILRDFTPQIRRLVRDRGSFNLIVGMAFFEGFLTRKYQSLINRNHSPSMR